MMNVLDKNEILKSEILKDETVQKLCTLYDIDIDPVPTENEATVGFVPVEDVTFITPPKRKDWLELGNYKELEDQKLYAKNYERVNFLVSRLGTEVFAVQNQCCYRSSFIHCCSCCCLLQARKRCGLFPPGLGSYPVLR